MILKRKIYTSISMRSPVLLLMTIVGNFCISQIIVLFKIFYNNNISAFYFFFRLMMILSLILRYERILKCYNIYNNNEREDEKYFSNKRYLYQEKYYFKILVICLLIIAILMIILNIVYQNDPQAFFRFNVIYYFDDMKDDVNKNITYKMNLIAWICWSFLEQILLIFYIFRTMSKYIIEKLKFEIIFSFIVWYVYVFICSTLNLYLKEDSLNKESNINLFLIIFSLLVQYSLLFVNGILPIVLSYYFRTSISYHFNPKLIGNLFLFLTNEQCYNTFYNYLKKNNNKNGLFYLKLYTHILKYKLNFAMTIDDKTEALNDLNEIYNTYFANDNYNGNLLDTAVVLKIRKEYQGLENRILPEIFDQALQNAFIELGKIFDEFHNKIEYSDLYYKIKEYSYIHCKMCNTGLINQN